MAKKTSSRKPVKVLKKKAPAKAKTPSKTTKKKVAKQVEPVVPEIAFNPSEHRLVPKHEVLNQEAVEQLFVSYKVSPQNLPVIFVSDAALKGLEVKMGDIIKITRRSPTAGEAVFFRRVAYE